MSITPDKDDIYITINITEGEKYTVSGVELAGDLVVPHDELARLVQLKAGDTFSRAKQQATTKSISDRLGAEGYAFANVSAVPEVDKQKHTVAYTLYVDPGRRVYVRRINIIGNARTRDEVVRREARQLEGAWFDSQRIDRSKVRIKRLGYFDDVNVETQPVAGSNDQVDLEFNVTERTTGNLLAGVGYSTSDGVVFSASVSQQNVLGTGNALAVGINTSKINRTISGVYTDPYWTVDGVSRTIELYQKNIDPTSLAVSNYESSTLGAGLSFGVPISESDTINLGGRIEHTKISLFAESPPVYIQYVNEFGAVTNSYILTAGWSRDTRDDILYPNEGRLQSFSLEVGLPLTNTAYYKAEYVNQWFWPIWAPAILMLRGNVGYADGYSGDPLPFFKAFYAGGVGSVRGYEQSSLGPRDVFGNSLGGKRKIVGNAELFYPLVKGDQCRARQRVRRPRPDLRQRRPARLRVVPLLRRRGRGVEFADRSAQVQLRYSPPVQARRPPAALPVPGRYGILTVSRAACRMQEISLKRILAILAAALALAATPAAAQAADYKIGFVNGERLLREAAPAKRAQAKLEKEFASRAGRPAEAREAGADGAAVARPRWRDDGGSRPPQQGARPRQHDARPAAHAARVPRGPEPAQERGTGQHAGARQQGDPADRDRREVRPDRAGAGDLREPADRHHRPRDQGARRQVIAGAEVAPPTPARTACRPISAISRSTSWPHAPARRASAMAPR